MADQQNQALDPVSESWDRNIKLRNDLASRAGKPDNLEIRPLDAPKQLMGSAVSSVGTGVKELSLGDVVRAGENVQNGSMLGEGINWLAGKAADTFLSPEHAVQAKMAAAAATGLADGANINGSSEGTNKAINTVADSADVVIKPVAQAVGGTIKTGGDWVKDSVSDQGKEAMSRQFFSEDKDGSLHAGDAWTTDPAVWAMKMSDVIGTVGGTLVVGGVVKGGVKAAVTRSMLKRGAPEAYAAQVAELTAQRIGEKAAFSAGAAMSVGQTADQTRESVKSLSFEELMNSDSFKQNVQLVNQDPQYQSLSSSDRLDLARQRTADMAADYAKSDPTTYAAAAAGTVLGDAMLFKMITGKAGASEVTGNILSRAGKGFIKGGVGEGVGEAAEEGAQQNIQNRSSNEIAGTSIDPMQGVAQSAAEAGLLGALSGGGIGAGSSVVHGSNNATKTDEASDHGGSQSVDQQDIVDSNAVNDINNKQPTDDSLNIPAYQRQGEISPELQAATQQAQADAQQFNKSLAAEENGVLAPIEKTVTGNPDEPAFLRTQQNNPTGRDTSTLQDANPYTEAQSALATGGAPTAEDLIQQSIQQGNQGKTPQETGVTGDLLLASEPTSVPATTEQSGTTIDGQSSEIIPESRGLGYNGQINMPGDPGNGINDNYVPPVTKSRTTADKSLDTESTRDPRSPVAQSIEQAGSESASIFDQLKTVRVTKRGKPFTSQKEAQLASRKTETPIELPTGGFGVVDKAELEQAQSNINSLPGGSDTDVADINQVADPVDVNESTSNQVVAQNQPDINVNDQPASQATVKQFATDIADPSHSGVGVIMPGGVETLVPDTSAQEVAPQDIVEKPWKSVIDKADGTMVMEGDPAQLREWAKKNNITAIKSKTGIVVGKNSAPEVKDIIAKSNAPTNIQQNEAAPIETPPGQPTEIMAPPQLAEAEGSIPTASMPWTNSIDKPDGTMILEGDPAVLKAWAKNNGITAIKSKNGVVVGKSSVQTAKDFILKQQEPGNVTSNGQFSTIPGASDVAASNNTGRGAAVGTLVAGEQSGNVNSAITDTNNAEDTAVESDRNGRDNALTNQQSTTRNTASTEKEKISDFGEKIGGAKKDIWQSLKDSMNGETAEDIQSIPLSKAWPEPNYQQLIDNKMHPFAAAFIRAARESIPTKPKLPSKVSTWSNQVKVLRDISISLADETINPDSLKEKMLSSGGRMRYLNDILGKSELYQAVGHDKSLADLTLTSGHYSVFNGEKYNPSKVIWSVNRKSKSTAFGNWPHMVTHADTKEQAISQFKAMYDSLPENSEATKRTATFDIFSKRDGSGFYIGKKIGRNPTLLEGPFKEVKDARKFKDEHIDELTAKLEKVKEIPRERRDINNPRVGEDMRGGRDVTPDMFTEAFGFRGVEFGNWVENDRRQRDLNDAYDALMDMAAVIGIPPKAVSLNGELGIAFGARGSGGKNPAAAHYEPGHIVINLTKKNGAGSLGHEWWHALDDYFARMRKTGDGNMTESRMVNLSANGSKYFHSGDVRKEMVDAFGAVIRGINNTALKARSSKLDAKRTKEYWTTNTEMSARAFESYLISKLQDQNASNDYLSNIVAPETWEAAEKLGFELDGSFPYPTAGEIPTIRGAFDKFFSIIDHKEENENIALFSKSSFESTNAEKSSKGMTKPEAAMVAKEWLRQFKTDINVEVVKDQAEFESALADRGFANSIQSGEMDNAAYLPDSKTILINASAIQNPKRLKQIMRHEILVHHGLRYVVGEDAYVKIMNAIAKGYETSPAIRSAVDTVTKNYADKDMLTQMEEAFAHYAENSPADSGPIGRLWQRIVGMVKSALQKVGFLGVNESEQQLDSVLRAIAKNMRNGIEEGVMAERDDDVMLSRSSTADDELMTKLGLGPKQDVIDKTKDRFNNLKQVDRAQVKSWIDETIKKANTQILDALAPIKYAEDAGGKVEASDSGYVAARLASGSATVMNATMLHGLPAWKDGVIQRKDGTGEADSLLGIFESLGSDLHNWLGWMAGHRGEILLTEGRENLLTPEDISALKAKGNGKEAKFEEARKKWNALNKAVLDLAEEAGLFTTEDRAAWDSEWYVPFFRETEDGDITGPYKHKGIANQTAGIKKLKGGTANVNDILQNIFTTTSKTIDAAMKNMAAQKVVHNLAETDLIEVITKPNLMDIKAAVKNQNDMMIVKLEGEDYLIRVNNKNLFNAMTMIDQKVDRGAVRRLAMKAKHILTAGVTASPDFMLRNFLRDAASTWAINEDGFKPMIDSIRGMKKAWKMDDSSIDMMFSGASFMGGNLRGNDPEAMASAVRKALRRKGMSPEQVDRYEKTIVRNGKQAMDAIGKYWEKYERVGEAVENGSREAVYEAAIKAGKTHAQAAFEAKDLMDFSMMGSSKLMQIFVDVLPFFNARMQGLGKLGRAIKANPKQIAKRGGMIAGASLALLALNWDDERYEDLPDWDKDLNWHFWLGDQHFRIPKPFEIGLMFGTLPERMARTMGGKDTAGKFGQVVARNMLETFAINPIPQVVKPLTEAYFNYDPFRGGPIESMSDMNVNPEARYDEQTSLMMRELGELTGMSPKKLEHVISGYTGTMGGYVMAMGDSIVRATGDYGDSPALRADQIPILKSVYQGSAPAKATQAMQDFYQMVDEANQVYATILQYRKEGRFDDANALLDENRDKLAGRKTLNKAQLQFRALRNEMSLIQRDKLLNSEQKRDRLDRLLKRRNDFAAQLISRFE